MLFSVFDRWGARTGTVEPIKATLTRDVAGTDTLELALATDANAPGKGDHLAARLPDGVGEWIVTSPAASRGDGRPTASLVCQGVISELDNKFVDEIRGETTASAAMQKILAETRWALGDVDSGAATADPEIYHVTALAAIQKICETFDLEPEVEIDTDGATVTRRTLHLRNARGTTTHPHRFAFGTDLVGVKRTVDASDVKTRLYGFGKGLQGGTVELAEKLDFAGVNGGKKYVEDDDATEQWGVPGPDGKKLPAEGIFEDGDCDDQATLLAETKAELQRAKLPKISYEVDVAMLGADTRLGDAVQIVDTTFTPSLRLEGRVLKEVRDLIKPAETKLTIGNLIDSWRTAQQKTDEAVGKLTGNAGAWSSAAGLDQQWLADLINGSNNGATADAAFCSAAIDIETNAAIAPDANGAYPARIDYAQGSDGSFSVADDGHGIKIGVAGWYLLTATVNVKRTSDEVTPQGGTDFTFAVLQSNGVRGALAGGLFWRFEEASNAVDRWQSSPMPTAAAYLRAGETVYIRADNNQRVAYGSLNRLQLFRMPFGNLRAGYNN